MAFVFRVRFDAESSSTRLARPKYTTWSRLGGLDVSLCKFLTGHMSSRELDDNESISNYEKLCR